MKKSEDNNGLQDAELVAARREFSTILQGLAERGRRIRLANSEAETPDQESDNRNEEQKGKLPTCPL
jgi:hypothetical protein